MQFTIVLALAALAFAGDYNNDYGNDNSGGNSYSGAKSYHRKPSHKKPACYDDQYHCQTEYVSTDFKQCAHGQWVHKQCGPGTACFYISPGKVNCGWPKNNRYHVPHYGHKNNDYDGDDDGDDGGYKAY